MFKASYVNQMRRSLLILAILTAFGISAGAQNRLRVGEQAPVFTTAAIDGTQVDLAASRGKVVLVTFWSTRCAICQSEIPKLNEMRARLGGKNVELLALSMEPESRITPFLKKHRFDFRIIADSFDVVLKYADRDKEGNLNMGFPAYFLIDAQGRIAFKDSGWDHSMELESRINSLLSVQIASARQ
ncbi:MAG: TlpA family protein disulfide reductase [Acidobacteria bacterium ACB1]|nr:TlpA family protein disulfide reductase [Acidobacteria bacterium ACB1]